MIFGNGFLHTAHPAAGVRVLGITYGRIARRISGPLVTQGGFRYLFQSGLLRAIRLVIIFLVDRVKIVCLVSLLSAGGVFRRNMRESGSGGVRGVVGGRSLRIAGAAVLGLAQAAGFVRRGFAGDRFVAELNAAGLVGSSRAFPFRGRDRTCFRAGGVMVISLTTSLPCAGSRAGVGIDIIIIGKSGCSGVLDGGSGVFRGILRNVHRSIFQNIRQNLLILLGLLGHTGRVRGAIFGEGGGGKQREGHDENQGQRQQFLLHNRSLL